MAKKKHVLISKKLLGLMVLTGLIIQYVLPMAGIHFLSKFAVLLYLIVGLYLALS